MLEPEYSTKLAAGLLTELGLSASQADRLQQLPMDQLQAAQVATLQKVQLPPAATAGGAQAWGPTVDGKVLPAHPFEPSAPAVSAHVPMIVGTVLNEQVNALFRPELAGMTEADLKKRLEQNFGASGARVLDAFRRGHPKASPLELFSLISAVSSYRQNAVTMATRKAALGAAPAFNYWFTWHTPLFEGTTGVFHCADLPFVFYNTDRCAAQTGGTPEARELSAKMADAWIHFARTGDPNHAGLPKWPAFNASEAPVMIFDDACEVRNNPDRDERQAILDAGGGYTRIRS
jgi:para-nitrobenzyl esterase